MTPNAKWVADLQASRGLVDAWIQRCAADAWVAPRQGPWTRKDLLGHLTAWSDLLLDQVEALRQGRPDTIQAIDVDGWNAVEVARRRDWPVEEVIAAWRHTTHRADQVVGALPPEAWAGHWQVPWADEPVSIDDVLRLMVVHLGQHEAELARDSPRVSEAGAV